MSAAARRFPARSVLELLRLVTALVDLGPDVVRFGRGRTIRSILLGRKLARLRAEESGDAVAPAGARAGRAERASRVLLVTRTLGTGGVERVVATLATELPRRGLDATVLCERGGAIADALRDEGVAVIEAPDLDSASERLRDMPDLAVAQLHNAPDHLVAACTNHELPLVPVLHTTDVNLDEAGWAGQAALTRDAARTIAVSRTVRDFHLHHTSEDAAGRISVVPNGVDPTYPAPSRLDARRRLGAVLGRSLGEAVVCCCLARYDLQKNIPGLVSSFLAAAARRDDLHLVVAGPVEDWLEVATAEAVRRADPAGDRVHLLGTSSTSDLLAASDVFVLDSFFEGWPIAATEAAMAGLPLVLSDVGGARELAEDGRGVVVANPAGPADRIDLPRIRRARRRLTRQANRDQFARTLVAVTDEIDVWRGRRTDLAERARDDLGSSVMAQAHAAILEVVAREAASA